MREELTTAEVAERNQRGYSYQRGKPVWKTRPVCRGERRACVTGAGRCVTDLFCAFQESLEWALWLAPGKSGHVTSSAFAQHRSVGNSLSLKNAFPTQISCPNAAVWVLP